MPLKLESSSLIECGPHRTACRTVSWSASGIYLAYGSSDRVTRLVTIEPTQAREVVVLTGHQGPVTHVRFHPTDKTLICTTARDQTVRLWDCRGGGQRETGILEMSGNGGTAVAIDWCKGTGNNSSNNNNNAVANTSHALAVTERGSRVVIYDTRKIGSSGTTAHHRSGTSATSTKSNPAILHVSEPQVKERIETAIFGPGNGRHLIAASQLYDNNFTSDLLVWDWTKNERRVASETDHNGDWRFPAHAEGIYAMDLSPDGKHLATGGADAIVGLWDTNTMTMVRTFPKRLKYIRSVAFSHDGQILAHSNEENDIELVDVNTGEEVGQVSLGNRRGGAEYVAWHPTYPILACARVDNHLLNGSPIAIAKLSVSSASQ